MIEICFATNNQHKILEIQHLLATSIRLVSLEEIGCSVELPETQTTIEGNSAQKARYVRDHFGVTCFADDTGLEVAALAGEPGVHSAYYSGERDSHKNITLLLQNLAGKSREAQFRTCITLATPTQEWQFEGIVAGTICNEPKGEGGFGYDAVFLPLYASKTFAQMEISEKNNLSHRAIATKKLIEFLQRNANLL